VQQSSRQGYNLLHWNSGHMTHWAVSDLNAAELESFAALVRRAE
jgi:anti-sigma factor RsiW